MRRLLVMESHQNVETTIVLSTPSNLLIKTLAKYPKEFLKPIWQNHFLKTEKKIHLTLKKLTN